jgi:hypothetical protein
MKARRYWFLACLSITAAIAGCAGRSAREGIPSEGIPPLHYTGRPTTFASEPLCDTCPDFQFALNLYPDSTFLWRKAINNRSWAPLTGHVDRGRWRVSKPDNLLIIEGEQWGTQAFAILSSQRLETRAPDGAPTTWALSYLLTRQKMLDRFAVPHELDGALSFRPDGSVTFTSCLYQTTSAVAPASLVDSIRTVYRRQRLPAGRPMSVGLAGHYAPEPRVGTNPDTLVIQWMRVFSWDNGCRQVYPPPRLGTAFWNLYELFGEQLDPDADPRVRLDVDTVEMSLAFSAGKCRGAGRYQVDPRLIMAFRPVEIELTKPCDGRDKQIAELFSKALMLTRVERIQSDILLLSDFGATIARLVAAGWK